MKIRFRLILFLMVASLTSIQAAGKENRESSDSLQNTSTTEISTQKVTSATRRQAGTKAKKGNRFIIGGYGEAVLTRNFYSDSWQRYIYPDKYVNDEGHGRFDLPHVVLFIGYDFGKGWSMGSEIEFEHGGVGAGVEIEEEETGEYESEIEKGGEVALEQFWIQKSWTPAANLRMGHIIVPIGLTNAHHTPTEFFGPFRPEGENTIIPCTWHETGISFWGESKGWRYEAQFIAGLDADRFNNRNWIRSGKGTPYEFKIANAYAAAVRIDNSSVKGLRIGLSGYVGNTAHNSLKRKNYRKYNGTVGIGALDFTYDDYNFIARGSFIYGHLTNSVGIAETNRRMKGFGITSPTNIGSDAMVAGIEMGYDFFGLNERLKSDSQKFIVYARYDYYDSMFRMGKNKEGQVLLDEPQWCRHKVSVGINYKPLESIVIKAEYSYRMFKPQFNDEPSLSIGIAYSGLFNRK